MRTNKFRSLVLSLSLLLVGVQMMSCNERIDAGNEGLLIKDYGSDKGVDDVTLASGRVWYNVFTERVVEVPLYVKTLDYPAFTVDAKGGGTFTIDPTISLNVIQGRSPGIYRKYRVGIDELFGTTVFNATKDAYRIEFNKHDVDWIVNNREQLETAIETNLTKQLSDEGFQLSKLTHGMQPPTSIQKAIDAKNKAFQDGLAKETELKTTEAQAKIDLVRARTDAEVNKLKQLNLTDKVLMEKFIDKWDGRTPLYGAAPTLFKNIN